MTPEQFCYWLQGRAELQPDAIPTAEEWQMIREHLGMVFVKVTPPLQQSFPKAPTSAAPADWMRWQTWCGITAPNTGAVATC